MKSTALLIFIALNFSSTLLAQNIDVNVLSSINKNESSFKNHYLNTTADLAVPTSVALPAAIALTGILTHNKAFVKDALFITASHITNATITYGFKYAIKRQRPYQKYSFVSLRAKRDDNVSFPSGHTSAAFTTATAVALRYKKWYYVAPAYIFASSVAWARMYQGVHYPSDVLAGAFVGTASAWLGYKAQKKWFAKKQSIKTAPAL
jgi:membrane-associated phospholipid phosphatase